MITLTDEQSQQISKAIADMIPPQYQAAYNALQTLSQAVKKDDKQKLKENI